MCSPDQAGEGAGASSKPKTWSITGDRRAARQVGQQIGPVFLALLDWARLRQGLPPKPRPPHDTPAA